MAVTAPAPDPAAGPPPSPVREPATSAVADPGHRQRWVAVATWVRNIGALLILFAAWQLWGTAIAQHHTQDDLRHQFAARVHAAHPPPAGFTLAPVSATLPTVAEGSPVALLQIPKIGLSQVVVNGTATADLDKGPGHYIGTAQPGQAGNVAIAGHRTTHGAPFNRLAELAPGDPIYLTDLAGQRLTYVVAEAPYPVSPSNITVLSYFGDDRLTLTTCNPEFSAAQRLIVVAEYRPTGATRPAPLLHRRAEPLYRVVASGEAGFDVDLLPAVLVELAVLVGLGLTNRRWSAILGAQSRWVVLVPVWAALLYLLANSLTSFLPSSV